MYFVMMGGRVGEWNTRCFDVILTEIWKRQRIPQIRNIFITALRKGGIKVKKREMSRTGKINIHPKRERDENVMECQP